MGTARPTTNGQALETLLPPMMARRLVDTVILGTADTDGGWISRWLRDRRPGLLRMVSEGLGL